MYFKMRNNFRRADWGASGSGIKKEFIGIRSLFF